MLLLQEYRWLAVVECGCLEGMESGQCYGVWFEGLAGQGWQRRG